MKIASKIYTALIFLFLFAPIAVLLVFSFNDSKSLSVFAGFSLRWYAELINDSMALQTLKNSVVLALSAMTISTVIGTAAAVGINKLRSRWYRSVMNTVTDLPMTNPDIITGISLMLMFVFVGRIFGATTSLNFFTMLIAHVTFCLPYVILQVLPKLQQMDPSLPEGRWILVARRWAPSLRWNCPRSCPVLSPAPLWHLPFLLMILWSVILLPARVSRLCRCTSTV